MIRITRSRWRRVALAALASTPLALTLAIGSAVAQETSSTAAAMSAPPEVMQWAFLSAAVAAGLGALGAAYAVAVVGGAAMGVIAEKPEMAGRALVFVGLAEGIAIYGLIVAIMILGYLP
jgi:V/A-type H+-transporting ATPase subunit K